MKFSISVSVLILAIGIMLGLMRRTQLETLKKDQRELISQAQKFQIDVEFSNRTSDQRATKRPRALPDSPQAMTGKLLAYAKEVELHDKDGTEPDEDFEKRGLELYKQLMALSDAELQSAIQALRDDESISLAARRSTVWSALFLMSEDHPVVSVALFTESAKLLGDDEISKYAFSSSLANWAKVDPVAALEWTRKNAATHPDIAGENAVQAIISGAAKKDLKLALKLVSEMNPEDFTTGLRTIAETGETPAQRTAIIAAIREKLAGISDLTNRDAHLNQALEAMGRSLSNEDFESVQSWLKNTQLSEQESAHFASGLSYSQTKQDTGRWIEWMEKTLPPDQLGESVDGLIGQWTQQDYVAAGKWLTKFPAGPAKSAAVSSYAVTVAEYEPQVAVQWALTLPTGKKRQETFVSIYENWPKNDSVAANIFAKQHGITLRTEP